MTMSERYLPTEAAARKRVPMATGVVDYFPDALAAVAEVSYKGNEQHNPGQPLHWSRDKSSDFADTIMRHLVERGTVDTDGLRHSAKLAWRALANLQVELEEAYGLDLPRNCKKGNTQNGLRSDIVATNDVAKVSADYATLERSGLIGGASSYSADREVGQRATGWHCLDKYHDTPEYVGR